MKTKYACFILFLSFWAPLTSMAQERENLLEQKKATQKLTFAWGDIYIPLELWGLPASYKAEVTLPLETVINILQEPIRFYQNDKPYFLNDLIGRSTISSREHRVMMFYDTTGAFPKYVSNPVSDKGGVWVPAPPDPLSGDIVLEDFEQQKVYLLSYETKVALANNLRMGDRITFTTPAKNAGIFLSALTIKILNPWEEFTPRFYVTPVDFALPDTAAWQIIHLSTLPHKLLRFDPEDPSGMKVQKAYEGNVKYRLLPMKGFRTANRYWSDEDYIVKPLMEITPVSLIEKPIDPFEIQEYIMVMNMGWVFKWGEIETDVVKKIFLKPEEYAASYQKPLTVLERRNAMQVIQARVTIAPVEGDLAQYIIDGTKPDSWKEIFAPCKGNTSFYFEDIIVRHANGQLYRLPVPFAVHVFGSER